MASWPAGRNPPPPVAGAAPWYNLSLKMSKGSQYLLYKSSNIQMRKPVFLTTLEWPPQLCIQKKMPCNFASHLDVGRSNITIK